MHYHCEIIMPPTDDIKCAVESILAPFDENLEGDDQNSHAFWDFWVIGGRWSGTKLEARLNKQRLDAFYDWMKQENVTVSGVKAGKERLQPSSQIAKVDAKWQEMFPELGKTPCSLFAHSNDQYNSSDLLPGDVCKLSAIPEGFSCGHIIFAAPSYEDSGWTGPLTAKHMLISSIWNGVSWQDSKWDGTIASALEEYKGNLESYKEAAQLAYTPTDDWLVVTVDYHG